MQEGRRLSGPRLVLFLRPGTGVTAFVAGRRVGGAVARNRARRILRAAWREARTGPLSGMQEDVDIVVLARPTISGARSNDLVPELIELAQRAGVASS